MNGRVIKVDSIDQLKYVPGHPLWVCEYCRSQFKSVDTDNCRNCGALLVRTSNWALLLKGVLPR